MIGVDSADEELVAASVHGDGQAFACIVDRYQAMVCAVTYSYLGDLALSEDAAQEAFLIAWQQLTTLRDPPRLRAWLAGIARNVAHAAIRKRGHDVVHRAASLDTGLAANALASPDEQTARREEEVILWTMLEQIPETYREPLVLYYREQQSVSAVAETMGISEDNVKQRLSRGRQVLKTKVEEHLVSLLKKTGPSTAFTASVLAALNIGVGKAAAAGTVTTATTTLGGSMTGATAGLLGGIAGAAIGVAGAVTGVVCSVRSARSPRERAYLVRMAWIMAVVVVLETAVFLYLAFFVPALFASPWFQGTFWSVHTIGLLLAIWRGNKRVAQIQIEDGTRPPPHLANGETMRRGGFQWNAGGWFGAQVGATLWMLPGAAVLLRASLVVALVWAGCFLLANVVGLLLWRKRASWSAYTAIQCFIAVTGVLSLVCIVVADVTDVLSIVTVGLQRGRLTAYTALSIFPLLMLWFAIVERNGRRNSDQMQ